jgi:hypothetical protein
MVSVRHQLANAATEVPDCQRSNHKIQTGWGLTFGLAKGLRRRPVVWRRGGKVTWLRQPQQDCVSCCWLAFACSVCLSGLAAFCHGCRFFLCKLWVHTLLVSMGSCANPVCFKFSLSQRMLPGISTERSCSLSTGQSWVFEQVYHHLAYLTRLVQYHYNLTGLVRA